MTSPGHLRAFTFGRAAGISIDVAQVPMRSNQFAAKTSAAESTVLLLRREGDAMHGYLICAGSEHDAMLAANDLAHTIGARTAECDVPAGLEFNDPGPSVPTDDSDDPDGAVENVVGWLVFEDGSSVAREVQMGYDPAETARILSNTIPTGCWVAVAIRKPSKKERTRNNKWLGHRLSTAVPVHHSMSPDAVVVSVLAGAPDRETVRLILDSTRSAMGGFDVSTKSRVADRRAAASPWLPGGIVSTLLGASAMFTPSVPALFGPLPAFLVAVGIVAVVVGLARFAGLLPSAWTRTRAMVAAGDFAPPARRRGRPKTPRQERRHGEKVIKARDGDYPLAPSSFLVGPQVVVGVVAPWAGAVSGESETRVRSVPPALLKRVGPLLGDTDQGPAHLSAWDFEGQCAVAGRAGSGKTQLTHALFGWSCLDRVQPSGLYGFPGERNALVAFESKGDGVSGYQSWAEHVGDKTVLVDLADATTPGIDILASAGSTSVAERANFFVNACRYAFTDGAIGDRSFETLLAVLPAAMLVTPDLLEGVEGVEPNGSPIYYAHVLLGGRGDDVGIAVANELKAATVHPEASAELREAVRGMSTLYGANVTPASRRNLQEAPRNKFRQLIELESWWSPSRRKVTWETILAKHRAVVINTGSSAAGQMVEESLNRQMSALLAYSLRHSIQRLCPGWQEQGRYVSIFADELALLSGTNETVFTWLKDQGRSYGVRSFLATQRPDQLSDAVRRAFMNFSTFISFTQEDMAAAREVADAVSGEEGEWAASDILQLPTYTAIVRTHVEKKRQSAFTVRVANFAADKRQFAVDQGYAVAGVVDPSSLPPMTPLENPHNPTDYPEYRPPPGPVVVAPVMADPVPHAPVGPTAFDDDESPPAAGGLADW